MPGPIKHAPSSFPPLDRSDIRKGKANPADTPKPTPEADVAGVGMCVFRTGPLFDVLKPTRY